MPEGEVACVGISPRGISGKHTRRANQKTGEKENRNRDQTRLQAEGARPGGRSEWPHENSRGGTVAVL